MAPIVGIMKDAGVPNNIAFPPLNKTVRLGSYWDRTGLVLGSYWAPTGILLGSYWILLKPSWDRATALLPGERARAGPCTVMQVAVF